MTETVPKDCQHLHPNGKGGRCDGTNLQLLPVGLRCRKCAGMHHFDGTRKTKENIKQCRERCCNWKKRNGNV